MTLEEQVKCLRVSLHDIFELASRQKSNRDCATDEGLISTALSAVRVIRRVADERKDRRHALEEALRESKSFAVVLKVMHPQYQEACDKLLSTINSVLEANKKNEHRLQRFGSRRSH